MRRSATLSRYPVHEFDNGFMVRVVKIKVGLRLFATLMRGDIYRKPGHNPIKQLGRSLQAPIVTACAGGSVQHGLSAAGGVYGFFEHCSAADKR